MAIAVETQKYVVPCYRAPEDEAWFHFLHGNVPGHQLDFIYRPEVPQGPLSRQHYSHVARLVQYIEPRAGCEYAFAIGNLSRDDTQHEPGRGGVALIFGLRIRGATDHAGRPDPPFSHGVAAIDRALDADALFEAATAFHRRVMGEGASAEWYRSYAERAPDDIEPVLADYVATFRDLPRPEPSAMTLAWTAGEGAPTGRMVFVYPDDAPFELLARAAARIAGVLYRSDVRWSVISSGREDDLPNGLTIRFLPESAIGPVDLAGELRWLEAIPDDDDALARELFGAFPVARASHTAGAWRTRYAAAGDEDAQPEEQDPSDSDITVKMDDATVRMSNPPVAPPEPPAPMIPIPVPLPLVEPPPPSEPRPAFAPSRTKAVGVAGGFLLAIAGMFYGLFVAARDTPVHVEPAPVVQQEPAPSPAPAEEKAVIEPGSTPVEAPAPPAERKKPVKEPAKRPTSAGRPCGVVINGQPCF